MRKTLLLCIMLLLCIWVQAQMSYLPHNQRGIVKNVIYDAYIPNKMYSIPLEGNTIFVSEDNGYTWNTLTRSDNGKLKKLKYNPKNNQLVYSLHEVITRGLMVYDLETGEEHRILGPNIVATAISRDFAFSEDLQKIIITSNEFVIFTSDGGNTWETIDYNGGEKAKIHPTYTDYIYYTSRGGEYIDDEYVPFSYLNYSSNGGQSWSQTKLYWDLADFELDLDNPENLFLVQQGKSYWDEQTEHFPPKVYRTNDFGQTLELLDLNLTSYSSNFIGGIFVNPHDSKHIVVLEMDEIAVSKDKGETWETTKYENALENVESYLLGKSVAFNPFELNEVFLDGEYVNLRSKDFGFSTTVVETPILMHTGYFTYYESDNELKHIYYSNKNGYTHFDLQNQNETNYFQTISDYISVSDRLYYADPTVEGRIFTIQTKPSLIWYEYEIVILEGHGATELGRVLSPHANIYKAFTDPNNPNKIWLLATLTYTSSHGVWMSLDITDPNNIQIKEYVMEEYNPEYEVPYDQYLYGIVVEENSQKITINANDKIYRSVDGGEVFVEKTNGLYDNGPLYIFDLTKVSGSEGNYLLAGNNGVYHTKDDGEEWQRVLEGWFHRVYTSKFNPNIWMAVEFRCSDCAGNGKIYLTGDAGETWNELYHPELERMTFYTSFAVFYEEEVHLYLDVYDRGPALFVINLENLDIEERELFTNKLNIYPNPTSDVINIGTDQKIENVQVYDLNGRLLLNEKQEKINVSSLTKGVYILRVTTEQGNQYSQKFIKK